MGIAYNPRMVSDNLVMCLDAANKKSYDNTENLLQYSQQIATISPWVNQNNITVVGNTTEVLAPDGTNTASKITYGQSNSQTLQSVTLESSQYTLSVWVRSVTGSCTVSLSMFLQPSPYTSLGSNIATVSTTWQRITLTVQGTAALYNYAINLPDAGTSIYAWGAQLEKSSSVGTYFATTTTAKTRSTIWSNLIGGTNNGSLTNGLTYNTSNSGSFVFDGIDDIVTFSNLNTNLQYFGCWCYLNSNITSSTSQIGFFKYAAENQRGLTFGASTALVDGETLCIFYENPNNNFYRTAITDNISSGWNYISLNWNGSNYDIYINGVIKTTTSGTSLGHVPLINITDLTLGYGFSVGQIFSGRMAHVSIYNRNLSQSEINQNFNALRGRYGI